MALQKNKRPIADFAFVSQNRRAGTTSVRIGDLVVGAAYSEPMHVKSLVDPQVSFFLPVTGSGRITSGNRFVEWTANRLIISNSYDRPFEFLTSANSIITLRVSPEKQLAALASALRDRHGPDATGADEILAKLLTRGPHIDPGRSWSVNYYAAIMSIVRLIDDCNCDEALLTRIGTEDLVTRLLAQLVLDQERGQQLEVEDGVHVATRSLRAVDLICEHIRNNIGSPLSIPQMEKLTGMTGRTLSYAFRARFDCTPQEWQRNFLLDHARAILKDPDYTGSVKALAYELGFSTPSSFAAFFKQRFGELPSETLTQSLRPRTKA